MEMAFQQLAPELIHQIYNTLPTISDVINLSLTCHRFNLLLRHSQKLCTLFAAADREFGPIHDIKMLVTYSSTLPAHAERDPVMSYALLRQMINIGAVGRRYEELYPSLRWQNDFIKRRALTNHEARDVRQAVYRYWLYSEAFHNRMYPRTRRLLPGAIEERSQLLRCWSTRDLIKIEDVRSIMDDILTYHICPTDGTVQQRIGKDNMFGGWQNAPHTYLRAGNRLEHLRDLFHSASDDCDLIRAEVSAVQARTTKMDGWGDDISQYYSVQSLLKLNPAQIMWLYDHAAYKWQVEALVREIGEDWFWNNGQTFLDTWTRVILARGEDAQDVRAQILDLGLGVAVNRDAQGEECDIDYIQYT